MSTLKRLHHQLQRQLEQWAQRMAHRADRHWAKQSDPLSRYY